MIDLKIIQSQLECSFVIIMNNYAFPCFFINKENGGFPSQKARYAENVSIWWRQND